MCLRRVLYSFCPRHPSGDVPSRTHDKYIAGSKLIAVSDLALKMVPSVYQLGLLRSIAQYVRQRVHIYMHLCM